jgi:hypothetical protein
VKPLRIDLATGPSLVAPSTRAHVVPLEINLHTGAWAGVPSTSLNMRPLHVALGVGGDRWVIRPFSIKPE